MMNGLMVTLHPVYHGRKSLQTAFLHLSRSYFFLVQQLSLKMIFELTLLLSEARYTGSLIVIPRIPLPIEIFQDSQGIDLSQL